MTGFSQSRPAVKAESINSGAAGVGTIAALRSRCSRDTRAEQRNERGAHSPRLAHRVAARPGAGRNPAVPASVVREDLGEQRRRILWLGLRRHVRHSGDPESFRRPDERLWTGRTDIPVRHQIQHRLLPQRSLRRVVAHLSSSVAGRVGPRRLGRRLCRVRVCDTPRRGGVVARAQRSERRASTSQAGEKEKRRARRANGRS